LITAVLPLAATGDPRTTTQSGASGELARVIRGTRQDHGEPRKSVSRPAPVARQSGQLVNGEIVMRPAPGSFMRETSRLAAAAEARGARSAQEEAREADRQLTRTLQAVEEEVRTRPQRYYPVLVTRPIPPQVRPPSDGAITPST